MDPNLKLSTEPGDLLSNPSMYQRLVGRLIYLTNTRSDLTFAMSVVSQFMHAPHTTQLDAVYHILRYLKTSPGLAYSTLLVTNQDYHALQILTMLDLKSIGTLPLDSVLSMVIILSLGKVRSKQLSLNLPLKLNIVLWLKAHEKFCGFGLFLMS